MKNNLNCSHIVYTDRTIHLTSMKRIEGTNKMAQVQIVQGSSNGNNWSFSTAKLPCLCTICLSTSSNKNCVYKAIRTVETHIVSEKLFNANV